MMQDSSPSVGTQIVNVINVAGPGGGGTRKGGQVWVLYQASSNSLEPANSQNRFK